MRSVLILAVSAATLLASPFLASPFLAIPLVRPAAAADLQAGHGWHDRFDAPSRGWRHRGRHRHHHARFHAEVRADDGYDVAELLDFSPSPPSPELIMHRDLPRPRGIIYNVPGERVRHRGAVIRANY